MKYFKATDGNFIAAVMTGESGEQEISREEYERILFAIEDCPEAPEGYLYRLRENLEWELWEAPFPLPADEEADAQDYLAALAQLGVKV